MARKNKEITPVSPRGHEVVHPVEGDIIDDITNKDDPLNHIMIPLIPLRMFIADLGRDGFKKVPIGFLLNEMHRLYKEDQDSD